MSRNIQQADTRAPTSDSMGEQPQEAWCAPIQLNAGQDEEETSLPSQEVISSSSFPSLVEFLSVLSIIAVLLMGGVVIYSEIHAKHDAIEETDVINNAANKIKTLYASGDYDDLTTANAVSHGAFPQTMVSGPSLNNRWKGAINVEPSAGDATAATKLGEPDHYFKISYSAVPSSVCFNIVPQLSQIFGTIVINGVAVQNLYTAHVPLDQKKLDIVCSNNSSTISVVSE